MALEHAILVSLQERPASGYELARRFDKSLGYFWRATHQQIYRTLARMEQAGWLSGRRVAQDGRLDKKVYTVRAAGRAEVERWLAQPTEPMPWRDELMVKVRAAALGGGAALRAEIERHRQLHAGRLAEYRAIERRDFAGRKDDRRHRVYHLILRAGILAEEGWLAWFDEALRIL